MAELTSDSNSSKRCADFLKDFSLYIDEEASMALCGEIEHHLSECADCEVIIDTLRQTVSLYHTLPPPQLPEPLHDRLFRAFHLEPFLSKSPTQGKTDTDQ